MTTLVRWDPITEVDTVQSEMSRLFDSFFNRGANGNGARRWIPAMDLAESDEELVLTADLPGMSEDDISIEVKDNVLAISGERKDERQESGDGYHRAERSFGRFSRTLTLPRGVDAQRVSAKFDRGVLEVHIPKPEDRKPHRVPIGSGDEQPAIEGAGTEK